MRTCYLCLVHDELGGQDVFCARIEHRFVLRNCEVRCRRAATKRAEAERDMYEKNVVLNFGRPPTAMPETSDPTQVFLGCISC